MEDCQEHHPACNKATDERPPARLLSIIHPPDSDDPIISLYQTNDSTQYSYAALSYCWGYCRPMKTTVDTLSAHQDDVPWSSLPTLFKDAIRVTLRLGMRYVWIDSLCIVQGDVEDFQKEAPHMGEIYSQAAVVLAAHGFRLNLERDGTREIKPAPQHESATKPLSVFVRRVMDHDNLFNTSMQTTTYWGRAWCFQERLFAPRILHFGGSYEELLFECNVHFRCECGRIRDQRLSNNSSTWSHLKSQLSISLQAFDADASGDRTNTRNDLWETYIALCEDYTARGLTFATDTLPASSSLARRLHPRLGRYYAGLWEHNIILGLQWESLDTRKCSRPEEYLAPSFSWSSRRGPVVWYYYTGRIPTAETHDFAKIVDIRCTPSTDDPFGPVCDGSITLRGYTTPMFLDKDMRMYRPDSRIKLLKEGFEECFVIMDSREDIIRATGGMEVKCLDIMEDTDPRYPYVSALILLPADGRPGAYRRIGFSTMRIDHFEEVQLEEITIV